MIVLRHLVLLKLVVYWHVFSVMFGISSHVSDALSACKIMTFKEAFFKCTKGYINHLHI